MKITAFIYAYLVVDFMFWQWTSSEHIWVEIYSYIGKKTQGQYQFPKYAITLSCKTLQRNVHEKKEKRKKKITPKKSAKGFPTVRLCKLRFLQSVFIWLWGPGNSSCCQNSRVGAAPNKDLPQMVPSCVKLQVSACPWNSCSLSYGLYFWHSI